MSPRRVCFLPLAFVLACGGSSKSAGPGTTEPAGPPRFVKKASIGWGFEPAGGKQRVYLSVTDEAGRAQSHLIVELPGTCTRTGPKPDQRAINTAVCMNGGTGVELDAIDTVGTIVVMQMRVDEGVAPDPMAREELARVPVPADAKIESAD